MALLNITNEVGGIEVIDTEWHLITRTYYDAMANADDRLTFAQTAALDVLVKAIIDTVQTPVDPTPAGITLNGLPLILNGQPVYLNN